MDKLIDTGEKIIELIATSSITTSLTIIGLLLIILTGSLAYLATTMKPDQVTPTFKATLFISLIGGMLFSAAGPSLALFWSAENSVKAATKKQSFFSLENNSEVKWVVRLVVFDPLAEKHKSIDRLKRLGTDEQIYTFVADYEDLVGHTAEEAVQMTGGSFKAGQHISAVIFPLTKDIFPANSLGLLQVVQNIEAGNENNFDQPFFRGKDIDFNKDLPKAKRNGISDYSLNNDELKQDYPHFCRLTLDLVSNKDYTAKKYIGGLNDDWHPLGFSRYIEKNPKSTKERSGKSCTIMQCCEFSDWQSFKSKWQNTFGSRAFLMENLEIEKIPGRVLIDFDQPDKQFIPNIGLRSLNYLKKS